MFLTGLYLIGLLASGVNATRFNNQIDFKQATVENARGKKGARAYKNQDRAFIGTKGCRTCIGIFDGHGAETGGIIAEFVCNYLPNKILKSDSLRSGAIADCSWMQKKIEIEKHYEGEKGGTTAVMGFIEGSKLLVANVGDSRAVGVLNGKIVQLSSDHKPSCKSEARRICKAGGFFHNGYVLNKQGGGLAVTRTFGDLPSHEDDVVIAVPEITEFSVQKGDKLIFASDGLWDVMNNEEVVQFLSEHTVDELVKEARKYKSRDDITAVVAVIK